MRLGRIQSEFESQCDYHSYIIRSPPVIKNIEMEFPTVEGFRNLASYVPVAQLVEHATFNRGVESSNLSRHTIVNYLRD